jgi:hypothetical protein
MSSRTEIQPDNTDELLQAAARRARLAPILSWAALAFGLGLVIVFLVEAGVFSALRPKPAPTPLTVEMPEQIAGAFARITGFDRENQPYVITAKKGYQDKETAELVHMEDLTGTFQRKSRQPFEPMWSLRKKIWRPTCRLWLKWTPERLPQTACK